MGVMSHVHALEHKGHVLRPAVLLHLLQVLRQHLPSHHLLEPSGILAVYGGFAGHEQRIPVFVIAHDPQEPVLLHIRGHRKAQLVLQHVEFRFRALVDIEELVVGSGRHPALHHIQVQPPGLGGLGIPGPVVEGLVRIVEGGDVAEFLLLDIFIVPQGDDHVRHGAVHHCLLLLHLGRPVDRVLHLHAVDALTVHLDAAQVPAVLHLALQVEHSVVDLYRRLP